MLIYDKDGYQMLSGLHTCQLMMETLVQGLKKEKIHYANFDTEKNKGYTMKQNLKVEVGGAFGGKYEYGLDLAWRTATGLLWIWFACFKLHAFILTEDIEKAIV